MPRLWRIRSVHPHIPRSINGHGVAENISGHASHRRHNGDGRPRVGLRDPGRRNAQEPRSDQRVEPAVPRRRPTAAGLLVQGRTGQSATPLVRYGRGQVGRPRGGRQQPPHRRGGALGGVQHRSEHHRTRRERRPQGREAGPGDERKSGYTPPCEADGSYRFTVYALNSDLDLQQGAPLSETLENIADHTIARGRLTATTIE